jgi:hypothetical protein
MSPAACARGEHRRLGFRKEKLTEGAPVVGDVWLGGGGSQRVMCIQGKCMQRLGTRDGVDDVSMSFGRGIDGVDVLRHAWVKQEGEVRSSSKRGRAPSCRYVSLGV